MNIANRTFSFNPAKLSLGAIVLLITAFLFINADWVYGQYAKVAKDTMMIYFMLLVVVALPFATRFPTVMPDKGAPFKFFLAFLATLIAMTGIAASGVLSSGMIGSIESIKLAIAFGFLHAFIKAYIEEIVFRYFLPFVVGLGDIISSVLFGLFHTGVSYLSGNPLPMASMVFLMGLGFIWSLVRGRGNAGLGLIGSTGSHFAYNLVAMGVKII